MMERTREIQDTKNDKKEEVDFKELDENYVYYVHHKLPDFLQRGDIQYGNRLLGYVDAMMATCATFLVIPLRNLNEKKESESLEEFLDSNKDQFVAFVVGFLLVCTIWESINIRSIIVKQINDFYVLCMIISMLLVTILPFSIALMGHYPKYKISVLITCIVLITIQITEAIMNFYAFRYTRLLHISIQNYPKEDLIFLRNMMCLQNTVFIKICILAGLFTLLEYRVSWFFIIFMLLLPHIRKCIFFIHRKLHGAPNKELCKFFARFKKGNISKERVEAFTDAAVAIIACVLILDITVEGFPTPSKVEHDGLGLALHHMTDEFVIFFITYIMISLLWHANHSIFQLFHTVNVVILSLQKSFLMFICWIPLAANCLNKYGRHNNEDNRIAVRLYGIIIFSGSLCNLLMLFWGIYAKDKVLHKWAICNDLKASFQKHLYILLKLINIPFWTAVMLFGTLGSTHWVTTITIMCFTFIIVTFIVLKVLKVLKVLFHAEEPEFQPREITYRVETGVIENRFVETTETNKISQNNAEVKQSGSCQVDDGIECNTAADEHDGAANRKENTSDSDVSELHSEYGSFRGGVKYINGVKIEVTPHV